MPFTRVTEKHMPIKNYVNGMVYHAAISKCVSIGYDERTWLWDGTDWTFLDIAGPGPRGEHAICYDSARQRTVVFGGFKEGDSAYNSETWEFDGSSWTLVTSTGPSARGNCRMVYDSGGARVLLYGGDLASAGPKGEFVGLDMWSWNGSAWSSLGAQGSSPPSNSTGTYIGPSVFNELPFAYPPPFAETGFNTEDPAGPDAAKNAYLPTSFDWLMGGFTQFDYVVASDVGRVTFYKTLTDDSGTDLFAAAILDFAPPGGPWLFNEHPEHRSGVYYYLVDSELIVEWYNVTKGDGIPRSFQAIFTATADTCRFQFKDVPGGSENYQTSPTAGMTFEWVWLNTSGSWQGAVATHSSHNAFTGIPPINDTSAYSFTFTPPAGGKFNPGSDPGSVAFGTPGRSWTELASTTPQFPEDRTYYGFSWHGNELVLAGGYSTDYESWQDTWTWSGVWVQEAVGSPLGYRTEIQMAYDSTRGRSVLFGGHFDYTNTVVNETLEWTGSAWTIARAGDTNGLGGSAAPSYFHTDGGIAFDSARGVVVLTDGQLTGLLPHMGETWEWNGTAWTRETNYPPPRRGPAAYDAARDELVIGPGITNGGGTLVSEERPVFTWHWDGTAWTRTAVVPAAGITNWFGAMMAYDSTRQRVVLFGGSINGANSNRIFEWDGTSWTEKTPGSGNPSGRRTGAFFFDPTINKCVQWGGNGGSNETWLWDGTAWTQWTQGGAVPANVFFAPNAYDLGRDKGVLYRVTETWEWTGGTGWVQITTSSNPGSLDEPGMAYTGDNKIVLFGGTALNADIWEYDGTDWTNVGAATGQLVHGRRGHAMVYHSGLGSALMYSGQDYDYSNYWNDIWTYGAVLQGAWGWHEDAPVWSLI
jgi:hypothetical protein